MHADTTVELPHKFRDTLERTRERLEAALGENLYSLILYGSAVRGDLVAAVSDLNVLIVLNVSTPEAHTAIADCLGTETLVSPMVVAREGLARTMALFGVKFRSIQRHYRVLHGVDALAGLSVPDELLKLECEQGLRNLRLRSVYAYIRSRQNAERYFRYLMDMDAVLFTELAEVLRIERQDVPTDFAARIHVIEQTFGFAMPVLNELLALKQKPRRLTAREIADFHAALFQLLDNAVRWVEVRWAS